jgi:hypothetical protein
LTPLQRDRGWADQDDVKSVLVDLIACIVGAVLLAGYFAIAVGARMALHITPGETRSRSS